MSSASFRWGMWFLLVGALAACLAVGMVGFLESALGAWDGGYFVWFAVLVVLEGYAVPSYLASGGRTAVGSRAGEPATGGRPRHSPAIVGQRADPTTLFKYRGPIRCVEILTILALLQALRMAIDTPRFDGLTVVLMAFTILAWQLGSAGARLFAQIDVPLTERVDHRSPYRRLAIALALGFLGLLAVTSVTQPWGVVALELPPSTAAAPIGNVLLYVVFGVLLLAYARYVANQSGWVRGAFELATTVRTGWIALALGVGGAALMLAFLAPHSMGRSYARHLSLCDITPNCHDRPVGGQCSVSFDGACGLPLTGLDRNRNRNHRPRGTVPRSGSGPKSASSKGATVPLRDVIIGLLALLAVGTACAIYLARRGRLRPLLRLLSSYLSMALSWLSHHSRLRLARGRLDASSATRPGSRPWSSALFRWHATKPREQIIRTYVRFTDQAGRDGLPRRVAQTASQYETALAGAVPPAAEELHHLTTSFLEARYSRREVEPATIPLATRAARQVRQQLRRKR